MGLSLLIGGARAGKSSLAARLAHKTGLPVTFVATAEAGDEEMKQRIARHRAERPAEWTTLEESVALAQAIDRAGADDTVIVDCLTLWVSNLVLAGHDDEEVQARAEAVVAQAAGRAGHTLVITNEVGLGIHPDSDLGRRFRDLLGRVNAIWADQAQEVFLVVAGRALTLKPVEL